jgi:hypothetical protein
LIPHELELAVGDAVRVGDYLLTVVDIDGQDVGFRVDPGESADDAILEAVERGPFRK